jgi:multidrug transporter EmrE-like cation transporter
MALIAYTALYTALATAGLLLLRRSLADASVAELLRDPAVLVGGALYAASFATFVAALREFEVLSVFPLFTGVTYATIAVAAALVLDEPLTPSRVAGIVLVGVGAVLLLR